MRSLITLKALTYAPTGGIVAAPTTSLPEELGGVRNWDYRYCWLRDSTLTLGALIAGGYQEEAEAWRDWLLRAVAGDPADLQIMYGLAGERRLPESELPWLSGFAGSRPYASATRPSNQLQLDVYGEVMDSLPWPGSSGLRHQAAHVAPPARPAGVPAVRSGGSRTRGCGRCAARRRHFVHSKVMVWVAADRAVRALEAEPEAAAATSSGWRALRDEVHREVCEQGYDAERNTFTQSYGSRELDAALLLIPRVGFLPPDDPAGRRHHRRGPRRARPRRLRAPLQHRRDGRSTDCPARRAPSWSARSGSRTPCT